MKKNRLNKKNLIITIVGIIILGVMLASFIMFPRAEQLKMYDLGVVSFISSISLNTDKTIALTKAQKAGFGWFREEYTYGKIINFNPYDMAYRQIRSQNRNILGLLTYPGPNVSHDEWQTYVKTVVERYPEVQAWEIMNEVDTQLSAKEYLPYLREAQIIIKARSKAMVLCSGLGEGGGAYIFWDSLAEEGGWDACDAIAVHIYHEGDPLQDYSQGTLAYKLQKIVANIKKNGGGKRIWVTEFGYDSSKVGLEEQAQWTTTGLSIISAFPEVERIFVYRLYENSDGYGIISEDLKEKEAFIAIQKWMEGGAPMRSIEITPEPKASPSPSPTITEALTDPQKSFIQVQENGIDPAGQEQYQIVVGLRDATGTPITDEKPSIILDGGQTELTDFTLKNTEWIGFVSSSEPGERTAKIEADKVELKTVKMVFGSSDEVTPQITPTPTTTFSPTPSVSISIEPQVTGINNNSIENDAAENSKGRSLAEWIILILIEIIDIGLIFWTIATIRKRTQE